MDLNQPEDSKSNSSIETDQLDQAITSDDYAAGTGRSYECVFCKRGFTTAQALGGHMNIHRKDRVKPRANSTSNPSNSSKIDLEYGRSSYPPLIQSYPHGVSQEVIMNYQSIYNSTPTLGYNNRPPYHDFYLQNSQQNSNQFGDIDYWRRNLSLEIGTSSRIEQDNKERNEGHVNEEDDLDLELRLGHDR